MLKLLAITLFFAQTVLLFAGAIIAEPGLTAVSDGQTVTLSWQTLQEENLRHFVIQRKTAEGAFIDLAYITPESDRNYEFIDRTAYKTDDAVYLYQLKIVETNGNVTTLREARVLHNVSSVRKTWGSIKALFR